MTYEDLTKKVVSDGCGEYFSILFSLIFFISIHFLFICSTLFCSTLDATENLFYHMKTKNGADASLEYLRQMGGEFSVEVNPTAGSKGGFSFNVNIGEKK